MALITTVEEIIAAGVRINQTNDNTMLADMQAADDHFITPILGDDLYETITADGVDDKYKPLIELCKRAEAPLAYWLDLPNIQTQISDRGLSKVVASNSESAHRWEYLEVREGLADKGCAALEQLLKHLFAKKADYDWTVPDAFQGIFLTGADFNKYFPVFQPYRTFESMRPIARQVEDQYIRTTIGDEFFEYLRDNPVPSAEEIMAIELMKKAVANLTIKTACEVLSVRISVNGFTAQLQERGSESINEGQQNAPAGQLGWLYQSTERTGESYLVKLKEYLDKTASDTVFEDYKSSDYYTAPVDPTTITSPNSTRQIFGL